MSVKKKLLEEIHPLRIIQEVQNWPALYVKYSPERANPNFKNKIWYEIAKALFSEWEAYDTEEKESKVSDLQRKWRNLRDTFKRQVEIEKKIREGRNIKKKTYVYFKYMLFLLPHIQAAEEEERQTVDTSQLDRLLSRHKRPTARRRHSRPAGEAPRHPRASRVIDEDEHFLMSLIPSFQKMTDNEKLTAKVEILKIIKQVRSGPGLLLCGPAQPHCSVKEELIPLETEELDSSDELGGDGAAQDSD